MKFKLIGTKTTLIPGNAGVIDDYCARPNIYEPVDAEAKRARAQFDPEAGDQNDAGDRKE